MDPRIPVNQQNPPPVLNNPQSNYMQPQMNKFGANGHASYMQQPMRPPNFQSSPRMGRNVATVGPLTGKMHQMVNLVFNCSFSRRGWVNILPKI